MTKFNPDWYAASAAGEHRTLNWYIARAQDGDEAAAKRALELLTGSTSALAVEQNGGQIDADVRAFLLVAAEQALKPSAGKRGNKRSPAVALRDWWASVEMHERLMAARTRGEELSVRAAALQTHAAEAAAGTVGELDPSNMAKRYEALKPAVEAFLRERSRDA